MKIAIFGDIHANLEGLEAVLQDAVDRDCTNFVCTGDIVGYNANPHECLDLVRQLDCPVVKGNHDEEASLDTDLAIRALKKPPSHGKPLGGVIILAEITL